MRRFLTLLLVAPVLAGAVLPAAVAAPAAAGAAPARIVSLAPSITETLFALGLGPRVAGVTDWCRWPPAARELPKVGGHIDPNFEAVAALSPDLVVVEKVHAAAREHLEALDIGALVVEHRDLEGILESLTLIGRACGADSAAAALRADLESRIEAVRARVAERSRPRALVVVGRTVADGSLADVYVAGGGTFLGELLVLAGGENAFAGGAIEYPALSAEGLLRLAPEVVVELAPELAGDPDRQDGLAAAWAGLQEMAGVEGRVRVFTDDWMLLPGPRCVAILERLADVLHPEPGDR